jgi:putative phosphoribosyl transferase
MEVGAGRFRDRTDAGQQLAASLAEYAHRPDVLVLGLARGGVPVAYEVAMALGVPLDVLVVRKLGVPGEEELALGAIASGGVRVLNRDVVRVLGIADATIDAVAAREQRELARREQIYRGDRPPPDLRGRTVLLVDDGIATGATMRAAIAAVRQQEPARVVVAAPVAEAFTCDELRAEGSDVVCVHTPRVFFAIGVWYEAFGQTTDGEIQALLDCAWQVRTTTQRSESDARA